MKMKRMTWLWLVVALFAGAMWVGCGDDDSGDPADSGADTDTDADADTDTDADTDADAGPDGGPAHDYLESENSDCLAGGEDKLAADAGAEGDAGEPFPASAEWSYDEASQTLAVTHHNAIFNCCPSGLRSWAEVGAAAIALREEDYLEGDDSWCDCECPYDLTSHVTGVAAGTYTLTIFYGDSTTPWYEVGEITVP
jgi:hypothetical protein